MTQYQYPFPLDTITTDFGAVDPEHPNPHRGTDFAPGGLPIPAVSDGVVVRDERQSGLGNVVTVRADDGIFWACSHMAARTPFNVGDRVARGDTVGVVGNTGSLSTGRHLHFTMSPSSDDPANGPVFDSIPYITARLTSSAGGSTSPFPSDEAAQEDDDMSYKVIEQAAPNGAEGGVEWMLIAPWLADVNDVKQRGYLVTTDKGRGDNWKRAYGAGAGKPHSRVGRDDYLISQEDARVLHAQWVADKSSSGGVQIDYAKLAAALPKPLTAGEIATAVNTDAAKRLSA